MAVKLARETLAKTPTEEKYYTMDFSEELETAETVTSVVSWVFTPTGPTAATPAISPDGKKVQALVSGGTDGVTYTATVTVETSGGETLQGSGRLMVGV